MKKLSLIIAFLYSLIAFAQNNDQFNKFSIETSFGLNHPLSPSDNTGFNTGDFSGFKHFDIGGRYMISQLYGFKLSYAYDRFQDKNTSELGLTFNRIGVEAVFNLTQVFNITFNRQQSFQIQAHSGLGLTFAQPESIDNSERIGNFIIGITPLFKVADRISITTDLSYILSFKQHYNYSGTLIDPDYKGTSGGFINFTVGLNFSIGENKNHADWY